MNLRGANTLCYRKFQIELDETDENGNSALHLAAKDSANLNIVKLLIELGADTQEKFRIFISKSIFNDKIISKKIFSKKFITIFR